MKKLIFSVSLVVILLLSCTNGNIFNFLVSEHTLIDIAPVTSLSAIPEYNGIQIIWTHSLSTNLNSIEIRCSSGYSTTIAYNPAITSFTVPGLTAHQSYDVSVYAINSAGYSSSAATVTQYAAAVNDLWVVNAGTNAINGLYERLATPIGLPVEGNDILYSHLPNNNYHLAYFDMAPLYDFLYCEPPYTDYSEYYYTYGSVNGTYQVAGAGNSPNPIVAIIN